MSKDAAAAIFELNQENSSAWIGLRSQTLFEQPWLDRFLSVTAKGGRQVLDLGCGSGQPIAEHFISKGFKITGIDGAAGLVMSHSLCEHCYRFGRSPNLASTPDISAHWMQQRRPL
ncbi:MAG: class I SAM-dependent methyltransferase [Paracoccaceae bacterium]